MPGQFVFHSRHPCLLVGHDLSVLRSCGVYVRISHLAFSVYKLVIWSIIIVFFPFMSRAMSDDFISPALSS